ncbi:PREDICTED: uncharacterized protein LOC107162130 [Diuraphis noxia]|uniref:uncharacterized protein LOC107162130 n=1 Tax=Diuraphis noxia TaxID=143948 RepID=UPI000763A300|nr:PREDICTED: uncharacterized protein LOC107162130 [Diuraphis noxia]XP_015364390.1 PREDICTED: uncharacterized protein LOC107162130 [Diuraphis noxia]
MKTRKCCVKGCTSVKRNPKISFFNAPKSNYLAWNLAVSNANCEKTFVKLVCAEHFRPEDIINTYSVPDDVANEVGNRIKIGLKKGIVPSIFSPVNKISNEISSSVYNSYSDHNYANFSSKQINKSNGKKLFIENMSKNIDEILTFKDLTTQFKRVVLPEGWTSHFSNDEIVFYKAKFNYGKMEIEKQLIFKSTLEICLYVYQFAIQIEKISCTLKYPMSIINLCQVIKVLDFKKICGGGPRSIDFPGVRVKTATLENNQLWRHQKCPILIDLKTKKCSACNFLINYFKKSVKQIKQSTNNGCTLTPTKCNIINNLKRSNKRLRTNITKINIELKELQEKQRQYKISEQNNS